MEIRTLSKEKDPMGAAILDYLTTGKADTLRILSSMFEEDEMPVSHLFRSQHDMPLLERKALDLAKGKILDVGAGAGCHALALQKQKKDVTAIDISLLSCEAMLKRGISNVQCVNLFDDGFKGEGKISNLPKLFKRLKELLASDGQILIDSSDIKYIYENEDGSFDIDLNANYYGEVDYQMVYKNIEGEPFDWLYVDFPLLSTIAEANGLHAELIAEGEHYDYLARISAIE